MPRHKNLKLLPNMPCLLLLCPQGNNPTATAKHSALRLPVLPSHHTTAFNPHCFSLPCPTTRRACRSSKTTGRLTFLTSCTSCAVWRLAYRGSEMLSWRDKGDNGAVDLFIVGRLGKANLDCAQQSRLPNLFSRSLDKIFSVSP